MARARNVGWDKLASSAGPPVIGSRIRSEVGRRSKRACPTLQNASEPTTHCNLVLCHT